MDGAVARRNQMHLVALLLSNDGPRFGDQMHERAFFIASTATFLDWTRRGRGADEIARQIETVWIGLIRESGVLSSPRREIAVFCLPALFDDPTQNVHVGDYLGTLQVRRTADDRVICWAPEKVWQHTTILQLEITRLRLRVIGPMVEERRKAAEAGAVYHDALVDVNLRLGEVQEHDHVNDAIGFLREDDLTTPIRCVVPMLHRTLYTPRPRAADGSSILFALVDYAFFLQTWPATTPEPPQNDLLSQIVVGEIARVGLLFDASVIRVVRLFLEEEQREAVDSIRAQFDEPGRCSHLLLCPLHLDDHWTLLYRLPFDEARAFIFDAMAPTTAEASRHYKHARQFASRIELFPLPIGEKQIAAECGLYVLTATACLIRNALLVGRRSSVHPIPTHSWRHLVAKAYTDMASFWKMDLDQRDRSVLDMLMTALLANKDQMLSV